MKIILFLIYLFVEVTVTLPVAWALGVFYTFLEILLSAVFGIAILFNTPFTIKDSFGKIIQNRLSAGVLPLAVTIRIFAAFLLILPGFFGDTTAVILLIWSMILLVGNKVRGNKTEDIIDVEIIEDKKMKELIIATRGSKLALWQSEYIKAKIEKRYPDIRVKLNIIKTKGDKILDTPLAKIGGKGLFTKELEEAMLGGEAHIAVHSLKDVPVVFPDGLKLGAVTKREDVRDAMLSEKYSNIKALPKGAVVGTTSLRRRMQLLHARPDLIIKSLRGNINTRIDKLKNGEFDAIILAVAGVKRLGLESETRYFSPMSIDFMIPAMGQAALGIEAVDELEILETICFLNDERAIIETKVERDFVEKLEGGCQVPIGVNAELNGNTLNISGVVGLPDGKELLHVKIETVKNAYKTAGLDLADTIIKKGAKEVLKRAEKMALETIFG